MRANGRREELVNFQDKGKRAFLITITSFFYYLSVKRRKKFPSGAVLEVGSAKWCDTDSWLQKNYFIRRKRW